MNLCVTLLTHRSTALTVTRIALIFPGHNSLRGHWSFVYYFLPFIHCFLQPPVGTNTFVTDKNIKPLKHEYTFYHAATTRCL